MSDPAEPAAPPEGEVSSEVPSPSPSPATDALPEEVVDTTPGQEKDVKAEIDAKTEAEMAGTETKAETDNKADAEVVPKAKDNKVDLLLKAAGDAPIMKQKLWKVEPSKEITWVVQFIRRYCKLDPSESLFVYVSQAFSPAPDQTIGNLLQCFGSEGKLVLHYCKTQAWG